MLLNEIIQDENNCFNSDEVDGYVWIVDGKVHVKNENKGGMPASINPCSSIKLEVNATEFKHAIYVSELDHIEIEGRELDTELIVDIDIEENGFKAYINYEPPSRYIHKVLDKPLINRLNVEVEKFTIKENRVSKKELLMEIRKKGIKYGILQDTIDEIYEKNQAGRFLIAEGKPGVLPTDDYLDCYFEDNYEREFSLEEDSAGYINYKNCYKYKDVKAGQILAIVHRGTPGKNGISVSGEKISVSKPKGINIIAGSYVNYDESTGIVKAKKGGNPRKFINGQNIRFKVVERLLLDKVDMKTGNIRFKGDVEVTENVYESMEVLSSNDILVKGNVSFSKLSAVNNIDVKGGLISGNILTGIENSICKDPSKHINRILEEIDYLIYNIQKITTSEMTLLNINTYSCLVAYLINSSNRLLPSTIYEVINILRKGDYNLDEQMLIKLINISKAFMGEFNLLIDLNNTIKLRNMIQGIFTCGKRQNVVGNVKLNYLLNSTVTALGNVTIKGKGAFNSRINAVGKVSIVGNMRGGEAVSSKEIEVNEAGSKNGVKTILAVPEDGRITIRVAYPDTVIKFGKQVLRFFKEQRSVFARLFEGKIVY